MQVHDKYDRNLKYFLKRFFKSFDLVGRKHTKYRYMGNTLARGKK